MHLAEFTTKFTPIQYANDWKLTGLRAFTAWRRAFTAKDDFMRESMEYPTIRRDEQSSIAHK